MDYYSDYIIARGVMKRILGDDYDKYIDDEDDDYDEDEEE